ncbi:hypothetical protein B0I37DRAFT_167909 [Chaetomium sp. MPI-CAGE-AT-0009]|nr:hypothetical protein B0I37DRAFT_167909 [Chaetomium sp. MPI-CAGE-AT-0009]
MSFSPARAATRGARGQGAFGSVGLRDLEASPRAFSLPTYYRKKVMEEPGGSVSGSGGPIPHFHTIPTTDFSSRLLVHTATSWRKERQLVSVSDLMTSSLNTKGMSLDANAARILHKCIILSFLFFFCFVLRSFDSIRAPLKFRHFRLQAP